MSRPLVLALAPILVASMSSLALAQAPGEVTVAPPPPPPPYAVDPCAASSGIDPLAHRWAVSLGVGAFTVVPEGAADGDEVNFDNTEVAIRYRASYRLELELALSGGRQVLEGGEEGDLANGSVMVGARYRFLPTRKWNWWVSAALGGTVIAPKWSNEYERDAAQRSVAQLGLGIERRFRRFALQAELKSMSIGERNDARGDYGMPVPDPAPLPPDGGGMTGSPPSDPAYTPSIGYTNRLAGGSFSVNLSYYF